MSFDRRARIAAAVLMVIALLASAAWFYSATRARIPRWVTESPVVQSWIDQVRASRSISSTRVFGYNHAVVIGSISDAVPGGQPEAMPPMAFRLCDLIVLKRQFRLRSDTPYVSYGDHTVRDDTPRKGESWVIHMHANAKGDWYADDMMRATAEPK